jgi:hypothetical protein
MRNTLFNFNQPVFDEDERLVIELQDIDDFPKNKSQ